MITNCLILFYLVCRGQFRHQTGDKGGGCFGYDNTDPITECNVSDPGASYEFFKEFGCKGSAIGSGKDSAHFNHLKISSIKLVCPHN